MGETVPTSAGNPLGGLANLISALQPIFLGSGKQVSTGNANSQQTTGQQQTSSQKQVSGTNPDVFSQLLSMFTAANQNSSTLPPNVQDLVNNLIKENINAFTPVIGQQNSSGLYNSSTLALLAGEAAARSSQQVASSVLNYQTSQQQLAANIGGTLANVTKTLSTTGDTGTTGQTNTTQNTTDTKQTQPVINIGGGSNSGLLNIGAIGGGLLLKSLLGSSSDKGGGLLDPIKKLFSGDDATTIGNIADSAVSTPAAINSFSTEPGSLGALSDVFSNSAATGGGDLAANFSIASPTLQVDPGVGDVSSGILGAGTSSLPTQSFTDFPGAFDSSFTDLSVNATTAIADTTGVGDTVGNLFNGSTPGIGRLIGTDLPGLFSGSSSFGDTLGNLGGDALSLGAGAAGGFAGNLVGKAIGENSPVGSTIGSSIGGIAGGIFGPVGSAIGSFFGSLLGGSIGQQHPETSYSSTGLVLNNGSLALGDTAAQQDANSGAERNNLQNQVDDLNKFMTAKGLQLANPTSPDAQGRNRISGSLLNQWLQFGDNNPGDIMPDITKFSDLNKAFGQFQFTANDPTLNSAISGRSFSDFSQFQQAINAAGTGQFFGSLLPTSSPSSPATKDEEDTIGSDIANNSISTNASANTNVGVGGTG